MVRITFLFLVLVVHKVFSQPNNIRKSRIDSIFLTTMEEEKIVGVSFAAVKNGEVFYAKSYGLKKLNTNDRVDSVTNFHLASISKVFVATAIMQLVEQGKIDLDKKLLDYIPVSKLRDRRFREITIRQMLTHISGIPDVMNYHWGHPKNDSLALGNYTRKKIRHKRLKFDPGAKFRYSNMAFEMLGHVIETTSGRSFDAYEHERVLVPAGLAHSNFDYYKIDPSRKSSPHIKKFGKVKPSGTYPYNREHGPSSTLNSCTYDMCRWIMEMQKIYDDTSGNYKGVVSHETLLKMWTPQHTAFPSITVGLSWFIFEGPLGLGVAHNGGDLGYGSTLQIYPKQKIGVIMLVNGDYAGRLFEIPQAIASLISDSIPKKVILTPEYIQLVEGKYVSTNDPEKQRTIHIKQVNGELVAKDGSYEYSIVPLGEGKFINPNDGASLQFNTTNQENITLLLFGSIELKKVR